MTNQNEDVAGLKTRQPTNWGTTKSNMPPRKEERRSLLQTAPVERKEDLVELMRIEGSTQAADQVGYLYEDNLTYIGEDNNRPLEVIKMLAAREASKELFGDDSCSFKFMQRLGTRKKGHRG